jgi:hypothetical protein
VDSLLTQTALEPETDYGYRVLFSGSPASLSERDQKAVYSALALALAPDGKSFVELECVDAFRRYAKATGAPYPPTTSSCTATYSVTMKDLNGDGVPEVFVVGVSAHKSRKFSSAIWLFVKARNGSYVSHFGFPAAGYRILDSKSKGFPDIQLGGGWCEGVWRWDGKTYSHRRNVPMRKGGCSSAP